MTSHAVEDGTVRDDPPAANDFGLVVRMVGGVVIVGPIAVTQDPASNPWIIAGDVNVAGWFGSAAPTVGQKTMADSIPVVIASDQTAIPVTGAFALASEGPTGAAVPADAVQVGFVDAAGLLRAARVHDLDSGAGTEFDIGVNLRRSGAGGSVELLAQQTSALSIPVVIASDQSAIAITTTQLPAALVGGRLDTNIGAWLGSTAPTVGQKLKANSIPVVISSDQGLIVSVFTQAAIGGGTGAFADQAGFSAGGVVQMAEVFDIDTGVGAQYVLGSNLRISANGGSIEAKGQQLSASSIPVVIASDQSQLPAALVGGRLDTNVGAWLGSTAPTVGQKTIASSVPVVIASDQSAIPVSGTVTVASVGLTGAAVPASADYAGFSDGTNLRGARVYDVDTGAGAEYTLGANLRISANGGSIEAKGQQVMASSIPVTLASDQTPLTPYADATQTTTITALNDAATVAALGKSTVGFIFDRLAAGTGAITLVAEISFDGGTTWVATRFSVSFDSSTSLFPGPQLTLTSGASADPTYGTIVLEGGVTHARARVSVFAAGTQSWSIRVTASDATTFWRRIQGQNAQGVSLPVGTTAPVQIAGHSGTGATPAAGNGNVMTLATSTQGNLAIVGAEAIGINPAAAAWPVRIAWVHVGGGGIQTPRVYDTDTGAGTDYTAGANLRISAGGGSIEAKGVQAGTSSIPVVGANGTLANGAQTTVDNTAGGVQIIAANANRTALIVQNVGTANMRVGVTGVTATTGVRLTPGQIWEPQVAPSNAVFAIREGATNTTALAQETT